MITDWLSALRRPFSAPRRSRNGRGRRRPSRPAPAAIQQLEERMLLSVTSVTSVTDTRVAFSTTGETLFKGDVPSKNFDYSLIDESFGTSFGGYSNLLDLGKTGVKVNVGGNIALGVKGGINMEGGSVDVGYLTDVNVTASGVDGSDINNLQFGDHFLVSASDTPDDGDISMSTAVSKLTGNLKLVADLSIGASIDAKIAGKSVIREGFNYGVDTSNTDLVGLDANLDTGAVDVSIFGQDANDLLDQTDYFNEVDRGVEFNISWFEGGVYAPQLATGVDGDGFDDSNWNGQEIVNKHLPLDFSDPVHRIDFLHAGGDVPEWLVSQLVYLGIPASTEFPELELTNNLQ